MLEGEEEKEKEKGMREGGKKGWEGTSHLSECIHFSETVINVLQKAWPGDREGGGGETGEGEKEEEARSGGGIEHIRSGAVDEATPSPHILCHLSQGIAGIFLLLQVCVFHTVTVAIQIESQGHTHTPSFPIPLNSLAVVQHAVPLLPTLRSLSLPQPLGLFLFIEVQEWNLRWSIVNLETWEREGQRGGEREGRTEGGGGREGGREGGEKGRREIKRGKETNSLTSFLLSTQGLP